MVSRQRSADFEEWKRMATSDTLAERMDGRPNPGWKRMDGRPNPGWERDVEQGDVREMNAGRDGK